MSSRRSSGANSQEEYDLIPPGDPRYFTETCPKSYDRHNYKLILKGGKEVVYTDYEYMRAVWFQHKFFCERVEVLD